MCETALKVREFCEHHNCHRHSLHVGGIWSTLKLDTVDRERGHLPQFCWDNGYKAGPSWVSWEDGPLDFSPHDGHTCGRVLSPSISGHGPHLGRTHTGSSSLLSFHHVGLTLGQAEGPVSPFPSPLMSRPRMHSPWVPMGAGAWCPVSGLYPAMPLKSMICRRYRSH